MEYSEIESLNLTARVQPYEPTSTLARTSFVLR